MALLEIRDLKVSYGFITALKGINIQVEQGQIVTLLPKNIIHFICNNRYQLNGRCHS